MMSPIFFYNIINDLKIVSHLLASLNKRISQVSFTEVSTAKYMIQVETWGISFK